MEKICDSFLGKRFEIPQLHKIVEFATTTASNIIKSNALLETSIFQLKSYLYEINHNNQEASTFLVYQCIVAKEKAIYNALNMMKTRGSNYIGFIWVPVEREEAVINMILSFGSAEFKPLRRDSSDEHLVDPPTYFKTNAVTYVF